MTTVATQELKRSAVTVSAAVAECSAATCGYQERFVVAELNGRFPSYCPYCAQDVSYSFEVVDLPEPGVS